MSEQGGTGQPGPATGRPSWRRWLPWAAYPAVLLLGFGVKAASADSGGGTALGHGVPIPTTTVTQTVEAAPVVETETATTTETRTVTKPPVTVKVRVTVRKTVTPRASATIPGDGTFVVGVDIKPGTYRTGGPDIDNCYWARLSSTDGDLDAIIANDNTSGPTTVTIRSTDAAFETDGCLDWERR